MKRFIVLAIALAAAAIAGCYRSDAMGPGRLAAGPTRVFVTDDPFPYDTVARVDLYIESIAISTDADTSANANWVTLATPNRRVNLLDFQNGKAALLDSADVPAGQYAAARVVIDTDSSRIVATTGASMNIDWQSSAGHPTLYAFIERPIGIPDSGAAVVIDFDAGRSFLWQTQLDRFTFSPVLRAVERAATGTVSGTLVSSTGSPLPHATLGTYTSDGLLRATSRTENDGTFNIAYLLPGSYTVRFEPQPGDPDRPTEDSVTIAAGQTVTGLRLVSQFCSATNPTGGCTASDTAGPLQCGAIAGCDTTQTDTTHTDTTSTSTVARILVSPDTQQVAVGDTARYTATAYDAQGHVVSGVAFSWAIRDSAYATVDNHGLVTGLAPGATTVFAFGPNAIGSAALYVKQP